MRLLACCAAVELRLTWFASVQVFAVPQTQTSLGGLIPSPDGSSVTFELVVPAQTGTGATFGHAQVTTFLAASALSIRLVA